MKSNEPTLRRRASRTRAYAYKMARFVHGRRPSSLNPSASRCRSATGQRPLPSMEVVGESNELKLAAATQSHLERGAKSKPSGFENESIGRARSLAYGEN